MYGRRVKIGRVREVLERLKSSASREINNAKTAIHRAQNEVLAAVSNEFHLMLNKCDEAEKVINKIIEGLLELQMGEIKGETSNMYQELCMKRDVALQDEHFTCVQFAMDCQVESVQRAAKGWLKQLAGLKLHIPKSLAQRTRDYSFCSGCLRQPNVIGSLIYRRITLPCGHYFHNKDCLANYLVNATSGFFYSPPIYRCPECWCVLDAAQLLPDLIRRVGKTEQRCCICKSGGDLYKRKQAGHYLCEVCADQGGLVDCRLCACTGGSIYSESRASPFTE